MYEEGIPECGWFFFVVRAYWWQRQQGGKVVPTVTAHPGNLLMGWNDPGAGGSQGKWFPRLQRVRAFF